MTPLPQLPLQLPFGVCTHRKALPAESQVSSVQALLSSQSTGKPPQALFAQTSFCVQGSPSSQGFVFATNAHCADPLQLSVVHGFPSLQSASWTQGIAHTSIDAAAASIKAKPQILTEPIHLAANPNPMVAPPCPGRRACYRESSSGRRRRQGRISIVTSRSNRPQEGGSSILRTPLEPPARRRCSS